jgi:hypothetical protein
VAEALATASPASSPHRCVHAGQNCYSAFLARKHMAMLHPSPPAMPINVKCTAACWLYHVRPRAYMVGDDE